MTRPEITVGSNALPRLYELCGARKLQRIRLIADRTTYGVLGEKAEAGFRDRGFHVASVVFPEDEVIVDARHILRVLLDYDGVPCTFVSVGSGTITDITRFVSHRTGNPFISLPTAPSVDGFTSTNVPMIIDGIKKSVTAHSPLAIFADTETLCRAPRSMIAAGFGDMLGKYTSVADWRLGHLLWDQSYDEEIARRALAAVNGCVDAANVIGKAGPEGIARLMEALIESGFCMTDFGSSLPASGAEHHYSHSWEMKLLREGRPAILHGAKVGVATILVAGLYEVIRGLSRGDVFDLLSESGPAAREKEVENITAAFGPMAPDLITAQSAFLDMDSARFEKLKERILEHWQDVLGIAAEVPAPARLAELLQVAGGPTTAQGLGLTPEDCAFATANAHYIRGSFTVRKLTELLFPGRGGSPASGSSCS